MKLELGHTEIFVTDTMAARTFYVDVLGFEVEMIQQETFVWLTRDGQVFLLKPRRKTPELPTYQHAPTAIVFYTDDLPGAAEALRGRGLEFKGTDGSDDCLTFTDPDGNWFQLVDPGHD